MAGEKQNTPVEQSKTVIFDDDLRHNFSNDKLKDFFDTGKAPDVGRFSCARYAQATKPGLIFIYR